LVRNAFFQHDDRQMALLMTERKPGDTLPAEDQESKNPTSAE
jgi:hypothetical protein